MRLVIGVTVLLVLLPKFALKCLIGLYRHKKISVYTNTYVGKNIEKIEHRTITVANKPLNDIDVWLLYIQRKLDLVGPHPKDFICTLKDESGTDERHRIRPGIISPTKIKRASGISHTSNADAANDFAKSATPFRRTQLLTIWAIQKLLTPGTKRLCYPSQFKLMGVTIANITMSSAITNIMRSLNNAATPTSLSKYAFVNADCVNKYQSQPQYKSALKQFNAVFADGVGIRLAARWQGLGVTENVNGTDMFPLLCTELAKQNKSVYLLGGTSSVVKKVVDKLRAQYSDLRVAGYSDGFQFKDNPSALHQLINQSEADLLLVAMGAPQQEQWIIDNQNHINAKAAIGVGGLFDFYSEEVSRAPEWLRELSLEWVWRLAVQPLDKGKRYLIGNPLFLFRAAVSARVKNQISRPTRMQHTKRG